MCKIVIPSIRIFNDNGIIREGMVHGRFKEKSFIVIVKNFETNEEEDFIVNEADFV